MNATKPIHIFKPGRHVSMAGDVIEFSEADIAATARAYDPKLHEAPLVIGHPKTDDPAQGWAGSLFVEKRGLFAVTRDVDAAFAEQVGQRRYGKVSAKFYSPTSPNNPVPGVWYLRHIGFLGAQPPGVKGLDDPAFADGGDDGCVAFQEAVEFGDWDDRNIAGMFRSLRDWFIAKFGLEEADKALPPWNVQTLADSAVQPEPEETKAAFAEASAAAHAVKTTQETDAVTPEEKAALEAENAQLKATLAQRDAADRAAQAAKRHQDNAAFAEGLVGKGVLAPKHKDAVVAVLDLAAMPGADGKSVEFGEGDAKQPLECAFKTFLGDMPKVVEFAEQATKDKAGKGGNGGAVDVAEFAEKSTDPDRLTLHVRATALAAEKGISYEQAARQLISN